MLTGMCLHHPMGFRELVFVFAQGFLPLFEGGARESSASRMCMFVC
jgi:hypothetical protein